MYTTQGSEHRVKEMHTKATQFHVCNGPWEAPGPEIRPSPDAKRGAAERPSDQGAWCPREAWGSQRVFERAGAFQADSSTPRHPRRAARGLQTGDTPHEEKPALLYNVITDSNGARASDDPSSSLLCTHMTLLCVVLFFVFSLSLL